MLSYEHDIYIYIQIPIHICIYICPVTCSDDLNSLACLYVRIPDLSLEVKVLLPLFPQRQKHFRSHIWWISE